MNPSYILGNYRIKPPPKVRKVYAKNPGEPLALFEVPSDSRVAALNEVKAAGFQRAMELVK